MKIRFIQEFIDCIRGKRLRVQDLKHFLNIHESIKNHILLLKDKLDKNEKIKVAFLFMYATDCQNLSIFEEMLKQDSIFDPFSIHAITENDEDETLKNSYKNLKNNGLLLIEVRSIKDQMFIDSQCLSDNEGVTDHYRRFIDFSKLKQKLEGLNFKIIYSIESTGLAIHGNEDPSIIRFVAQKKDYKL